MHARIGLLLMAAALTMSVGCEEVEDGCKDGQCDRNVGSLISFTSDDDSQAAEPVDYKYFSPLWGHYALAPVSPEVPAMNPPLETREHNYAGGSCVHASTETHMRWQNQLDWAAKWRAKYSGGESLPGLTGKMQSEGLNYDYTGSGEVEFLEKCSRTRRGAIIFYFPNHSIDFCGFHADEAWLLDNNRTGYYIRVPKAEFISRWKGYGGVAVCVVFDSGPIPPPWHAASL